MACIFLTRNKIEHPWQGNFCLQRQFTRTVMSGSDAQAKKKRDLTNKVAEDVANEASTWQNN